MNTQIVNSALIAMALIFVGSFVQTAIGFGLAIVAAPLLFLVSPEYVPAPISSRWPVHFYIQCV